MIAAGATVGARRTPTQPVTFWGCGTGNTDVAKRLLRRAPLMDSVLIASVLVACAAASLI